MKYLFIAEKPSLMNDVKQCYNKHLTEISLKVGEIDFIALSGHVCTLKTPNEYSTWSDYKWYEIDYPMIPDDFLIKAIDDNNKKKVINKIQTISKKYDGIIVGTDSDVEGYGIYYLLEKYIGIQNKKALRYIEQSNTDKEILSSLLSMTDYHKDITHIRAVNSFKLRSYADWLYGMNLSRLVTVKAGNGTFHIGRVKAPTIRLIYDNSKAIENFKAETFYKLYAQYDNFRCLLYSNEDNKEKRFFNKEHVERIRDLFSNSYKKGQVVERKSVVKSEKAPKLYDLATIQTEAGQKYGFKPTETLEIIQDLYEKHKLVSYPRTQCRYISKEKALEIKNVIDILKGKFDVFDELISRLGRDDYENFVINKNVVNDKEVLKESHYALIPTEKEPDLSKLNDKEKIIYEMICRRLICQFAGDYKHQDVTLKIKHGQHLFIGSGKTTVKFGWKSFYKIPNDVELPNLNEGDDISANDFIIVQSSTKPPKRLNAHSIIFAMENIASLIEDKELRKSLTESKGLGTAATRAKIIDEIIKDGYVDDKKDGFYITPRGEIYVETIKDIPIINPIFAAEIDTMIKKVKRGEADFDNVYKEVISNLKMTCDNIDKHVIKKDSVLNINCPVCQSKLLNTKFKYKCLCGFEIQKTICGVSIDEELLKNLCLGKVMGPYTFTKKDETSFLCRMKLIVDNDREYKLNDSSYTGKKIGFDYSSRYKCPACGSDTKHNKTGVFCNNPNCSFKLFKNTYGHALTEDEIDELFQMKKLKNVSCVSKAGKSYKADFILNGSCVQLDFNI